MANVLFWLLMSILLIVTGVALRAALHGPRTPGRIAFVIGLILVAFPWVRSWLSVDGAGTFHPANAIAQFEWLLVGLALAPIQIVCLYAILTNRKIVTNG